MASQDEALITKLDETLFEIFWETYGARIALNKKFIKQVFLTVDLKYKMLIGDANSPKMVLLKNIGVYDMVSYIVEEHKFHLSVTKPEVRDFLEKDPKYFDLLVRICFDKIVANELNSVEAKSIISKYSVEVSLLTMYINRLFILLKSLKLDGNDVKANLLMDIYAKCFMLTKETLMQLCDGLETEAMSSWRTYHELLCVLCVIDKGNDDVAKAYKRHLRYGAYHRGEIVDEAEKAEIEKMIEEDMLALQVKKANKEKFINYGWLHWDFKRYNDEEVKMNFLGGVQKVAELTQYKKYYEKASDVTHSTPYLVYPNKLDLTTTTLKITFEQFFQTETMFINWIANSLKVNPNEDRVFYEYLKFRNFYKPKIETIYKHLNAFYMSTHKNNIPIVNEEEKTNEQ